MQDNWKGCLIRCLKMITKILIVIVSCGMTFMGILIMLIPLMPLLAITGRRGIVHSNGEGERIFRFSKTLIYTFVGWVEGVLLCLAGYVRHIGRAVRFSDEQIMNPVEFWKAYTSRDEFINREKWVKEKTPDPNALAFMRGLPDLLSTLTFLVIWLGIWIICLIKVIFEEIWRVLWYFIKCPLCYGVHIVRIVSGQENGFKRPGLFLNEYKTAERAKREKHKAEKEAEKAEWEGIKIKSAQEVLSMHWGRVRWPIFYARYVIQNVLKHEENVKSLSSFRKEYEAARLAEWKKRKAEEAERRLKEESERQAENPPELPALAPRIRRKKKKRRSKWR